MNITLGRSTLGTLAGVVLCVPLLGLGAGYWLGATHHDETATLAARSGQDLAEQRQQIETVVRDAKEGVNALTLRVGELQAHMVRLDALGKRLVEMAKLDEGEFDFDSPPAIGGPEDLPSEAEPVGVPDFLTKLERLSAQLENRQRQLAVLESVLMNRDLQDEVFPAGRPIEKGWMSSHFGYRTDPFTGKQAFHHGVDFAGKSGSDVLAAAAGVVTWAGDRYGYGDLVELDHGNGLVTRYGHNKKILVDVGDKIEKGQVIALMGSSGRSTGPHVHFEVLRNGKKVDPARYLQAAR